MDSVDDKLPVIIQRIIKIDRALLEYRRAPVVRLTEDFRRILRERRWLVKEAHKKWGNEAKGKE